MIKPSLFKISGDKIGVTQISHSPKPKDFVISYGMLRSISDVFKDLEASMTGEKISFASILETFHERGFGFLLLIFATPMALPLPVPPGINIMLATPLIILTAQQALGRHTIWLPLWVKRKSIKCETLSKIIQFSIPWFERIEKLVKPRLEFMTKGIASNLIGVFGLLMALMVCVPLPLTNTVPSLGIALMAVGVIMRDGVFVLAGAVIGMVWTLALTAILSFLGIQGIEMIIGMIKSLF